MRWLVRSIVAALGFGLTLGGAPASAQLPSPEAPAPSAPLTVPYIAQSELLCGGAAVAMVERWWGRRGVYAEDFTAIVRRKERGIRTSDLEDATRARGWRTHAFDGSAAEVQRLLGAQLPVVALIRVGKNRYHYIVLLAWAGNRVVYHDPALGPSRSVTEGRFLEQWEGAERWAMVLQPAEPVVRVPAAMAPAGEGPAERRPLAADSMPCRPFLNEAVDAATDGRLDAASDRLADAARACPAEPLVLRELAAVRFKQRRLPEAIRLSDAYVIRSPDDALGWQLLAASQYLSGDRDAALSAWNHVGAPTVDLVRIDGVKAIRFRPLQDAIGLPVQSMLTPGALALARRRLDDVPAVRRSSIAYQPVEGGRVEVRAAISERPVLEPVWRLLGVGALRAITQSEVMLSVASPTGGGELWNGAWRWEHAHPRAALRLDVPVHGGVLDAEGVWEQFRFALDTTGTGTLAEKRHAAGIGFGGWITPSLRPTAGLRLEQWSGARKYLSMSAGTEFRAAGDRFTLSGSFDHGQALAQHPSYSRGGVRAMWSSSLGLEHATWSSRIGVDLVSHETPLGLWPVASGDLAWAIPLRAHSRTTAGLLPGATAGRSMIHGGLSGDQPVYRWGPFTFALGVFLDGAEILHPADGSSRNRLYLDAGGGLRIALLDGHLGVLRLDLATGLLDRNTALTIGMQQEWPPR